MTLRTTLMATALLAIGGIAGPIALAQPYGPPPGPPPGGDPNGYYSQSDPNGYYDQNGQYHQIQQAGPPPGYGPPPGPPPGYGPPPPGYGPPPGPPPDYGPPPPGPVAANCQQNNRVAGTLGGALVGGLIGGAASRGNGGAIVGGAIAGGILGNVIAGDIDCQDQPYAYGEFTVGLNGAIGQQYGWRHGNSYGYFTPTREFRRGGEVCRDFTETSYRGGRATTHTGVACHQRDGSWKYD